MGSVSRNIIVVAATAIFLAAATAAALTLGASSVSLPELAAWLVGGDVSDMARNILENVRVPRVLAALLAGAALATSGALIQACLDNPLASPNVIGVNSGAGLAVLLAASLVPGALWLTPLAAFIGALATALIIFALSLGTGLSRLTVVLAGIAITTAMLSALTGRKVRGDVAMTGEITLHGNVLPIGGLREKSMAAYREGMKTVLIPKDNEPDLYDVDEEVKKNLTFLPMQNLSQVLAAALLKPKAAKSTAGRPRTKKSKAGESRIPAAPEKNQPGAVC